jgi:Uma2 family endonuclease
MPQTLAAPPELPSDPFRVQWTREDCARFLERGDLKPGRYELIFGDIRHKMGQKRPHSIAIINVLAWCISIFGSDYVQTQATIDVAPEDNPTSEPEPDVFVLNRPNNEFPVAFPNAADLALVVEVSDTTLAFDLSVKARLYARAGIIEYWVLDVVGRGLIVHRHPEDGQYRTILHYAADESVNTIALSNTPVVVSSLLPPFPQS